MKIEGMSCQHCVKAVKEAIEKVDGVKSARVELEEGMAYIEGENYSEEAVKDAVRKAGYEVK